jgi:hypothetical protein
MDTKLRQSATEPSTRSRLYVRTSRKHNTAVRQQLNTRRPPTDRPLGRGRGLFVGRCQTTSHQRSPATFTIQRLGPVGRSVDCNFNTLRHPTDATLHPTPSRVQCTGHASFRASTTEQCNKCQTIEIHQLSTNKR